MTPYSQMGEKARVLRRWHALKNERSTWLEEWRELADWLNPNAARFITADRNRRRRNKKIINGFPLRAVHYLAAGLMGGLTSPSRPWFDVTVADPDLAENHAVKLWLEIVVERLREIFNRSNIYRCLYQVYVELGSFGVSTLHVEEDDEDVIRGYVFPVGQYALATSSRQKVETIYREFSMTVEQAVEKFGYDSCSAHIQRLYQDGQFDQWVEIIHAVEPNRSAQPGKIGPAGMPWKSIWVEKAGDERDGPLRVSGFNEFPTLCPRWHSIGEDAYGIGPGSDALGDAKSMQIYESDKALIVQRIADPAMNVPSSTGVNRAYSFLPGEQIPTDATVAGGRAEPAYVPHPNATAEVRESIREHIERVGAMFFVDLFLSILESRGQMTAREVAERHEEKMLMLGPALERLNDELLGPLIDRAFGIALDRGLIPPPPVELEGVELKVEYISILAQAQKLVGMTSTERFLMGVQAIAEFDPAVLDKIDMDAVVNEMADMLGVPASMLRSQDEVDQRRAARAEAEQAERQGAAMLAATEGARNLSQASLEEDNLLSQLRAAFGGERMGMAA